MVQIYPYGNAHLTIVLDAGPQHVYTPGSMITGSVVRRSPIVAPEATATIWLQARLKTKIRVRRGNDTYIYRSRWLLLAPNAHIQTLFHAPAHLSQEQIDGGTTLSWPFTICIPYVPDFTAEDGHFSGESFLTLGQQHPLPGTYTSPLFTSDEDGYVEYSVQANLKYRRGRSDHSDVAALPIMMRHPPPVRPLADYNSQISVTDVRIVSQRLIPGMEHAHLSFKQKTQKLFHTSTVPEFHFQVEISSPRTLQLEHPWPIPFILRLIPRPERTTELIRNEEQQVRINWVRLNIRTEDWLVAPSAFKQVNTKYGMAKPTLGFEKVFQRLDAPIVISCKHGDKGQNMLNLGERFQVVLGGYGLAANGQWLNPMQLHPDFDTYAIRHRNSRLYWELSLTVAEETKTIKVKNGLAILAPS